MKRKFLEFLILLMVGAGVIFGVSAPVQAVGPCYSMTICFFNESSTYAHHDNCEVYDCNIGAGDCRTTSPITSFISNTSTREWRVFRSTNCTGTAGRIYARSSGPMTGTWNNSIQSYYRYN